MVVKVNADFGLVEEPYFVRRAFYKKDFQHLLDDNEAEDAAAEDTPFFYYEIWWGHNNHVWRIKENFPRV